MKHLNDIKHINHAQFIENVLGIQLTLEDTCVIMEGKMPDSLKDRILSETLIYEGFLDSLINKIGNVPKNFERNLKDGKDFLTFIYKVISDQSGENLKRAIDTLKRNTMQLYRKATQVAETLPDKIKKIVMEVIEWIDTKAKSFLNEDANWKKFIILLLYGILLILLKNIPDLLKIGGDAIVGDIRTYSAEAIKKIEYVVSILERVWNFIKELIPDVAAQAAQAVTLGSAAVSSPIVGKILTIISIYQTLKLVGPIVDELLDNNAWLRKTDYGRNSSRSFNLI